jgi:hypothetical protein
VRERYIAGADPSLTRYVRVGVPLRIFSEVYLFRDELLAV